MQQDQFLDVIDRDEAERRFHAVLDLRPLASEDVSLADAWQRLGVPLIIGETGELGPNRAGWLRYLLGEVELARNAGVPVLGVCWYPIVSTPDWQDPTTLFAGGWWDSVASGSRLPIRAALWLS